MDLVIEASVTLAHRTATRIGKFEANLIDEVKLEDIITVTLLTTIDHD